VSCQACLERAALFGAHPLTNEHLLLLQTTLLDVLADRKTGGHVEGDIRVNGHTKVAETFARVSGYGEHAFQTVKPHPAACRRHFRTRQRLLCPLIAQ
jgi:hypothetical protein